jgi:hypothetical protein
VLNRVVAAVDMTKKPSPPSCKDPSSMLNAALDVNFQAL